MFVSRHVPFTGFVSPIFNVCIIHAVGIFIIIYFIYLITVHKFKEFSESTAGLD